MRYRSALGLLMIGELCGGVTLDGRPPSVEKPSLSAMSKPHCAMQLLRRHAKVGNTLGEMLRACDNLPVQPDKDLFVFWCLISGVIPVQLTDEDTVFVVRSPTLPCGNYDGIYFRVSGKWDQSQLRELFRGKDMNCKDAVILEIGF